MKFLKREKKKNTVTMKFEESIKYKKYIGEIFFFDGKGEKMKRKKKIRGRNRARKLILHFNIFRVL